MSQKYKEAEEALRVLLKYKINSHACTPDVQNKYTNCKGIKNNSNTGQITGIQEKLDTTYK
jgi:hypothetical protein